MPQSLDPISACQHLQRIATFHRHPPQRPQSVPDRYNGANKGSPSCGPQYEPPQLTPDVHEQMPRTSQAEPELTRATVIPYQEPEAKQDAQDMSSSLSSTLPMAAMFMRNKMIGWCVLSSWPHSPRPPSGRAVVSLGGNARSQMANRRQGGLGCLHPELAGREREREEERCHAGVLVRWHVL